MKNLWIVILFLAVSSFGQKEITGLTNVPDTSFTLYSSYKKYLKDFPQIKPVYFAESEKVTVKRNLVYASYKNRKMLLDLYLPNLKPDKPYPVVVMIFGGGWRSGNKNMEAPMASFLAKQGYACAAVEYRLSTEALYPAAVEDVKTAIRWLRKNAKKYNLDTEQVASYGCSAGGQLASLIGATNDTPLYIDKKFYPKYSSNVQAIVNIDGTMAFIHPESGEGADKPGKTSAGTFWFGKNSIEGRSLWIEASPLTYVGKSTPPILFVNSQFDRFHAGRNDAIKILDSLNIYSEIHKVENSPHAFWLFDPWFEPTSNWVLNFLDNHLKK